MIMFPYIGAAAVRHELTLAFNAKRHLCGELTAIAVYQIKSFLMSMCMATCALVLAPLFSGIREVWVHYLRPQYSIDVLKPLSVRLAVSFLQPSCVGAIPILHKVADLMGNRAGEYQFGRDGVSGADDGVFSEGRVFQ